MSSIKENNLFKAVSIAALAIVGLFLFIILINGLNIGNGMGSGSTATSIILLIVKMFTGLFIVGLIAGIGVWAYALVTKKETIQEQEDAPQNVEVVNNTCTDCGKEIRDDWNLCPNCGKQLKNINESEEIK